jgi:solute carrier family 35, member E1
MATLPLTGFQIGGHILNSDAMSRIPVSLVHTIKGLSPLMTVFAYRVFYDIRYSTPIYLSLIPLTLGVIMACSASFKGNLVGLTYAFGSAILFVTQNIASKKIFNEAAKAEADGMPMQRRKPDKLNLLCYSSATAFLITLPIWLWSEGFSIAADYFKDGSIDLRERPGSLDHGRLALEFIFNGTFHFGQSLVAFVLLGMVSPVTYSVASLIKRVVVIMFAIVWFGNPMTTVQGLGFGLTFLGLYLYDRTSDATKADKKAREKAETESALLPLNVTDLKKDDTAIYSASPIGLANGHAHFAGGSGYSNGESVGSGPGRPRGRSSATPPNANGVPISLPPGTKAEETWNAMDVGRQDAVAVR